MSKIMTPAGPAIRSLFACLVALVSLLTSLSCKDRDTPHLASQNDREQKPSLNEWQEQFQASTSAVLAVALLGGGKISDPDDWYFILLIENTSDKWLEVPMAVINPSFPVLDFSYNDKPILYMGSEALPSQKDWDTTVKLPPLTTVSFAFPVPQGQGFRYEQKLGKYTVRWPTHKSAMVQFELTPTGDLKMQNK